MLPFVLPGSRLHLEHKGRDDWSVEEGDIVCFLGSGGRMVAHRVVEIVDGDDGPRYSIAGDTTGGREMVDPAEIASVVTRVETNLFSYETRRGFGKALARMAIDRSAPFLGMLVAASAGLRFYSAAVKLGISGPIKRIVVGD